MFKKTGVALILMVMVTLLGCTSHETETMTFSILYNNTEDAPYREDWAILDAYLNLKNVRLDVRLGDDEDFETAIALNLNAENPPDVILKCWPDTIESYANDGQLVAISDYEHLMPNYQAYIEAHGLQNEIDELRLSNGKYYILPGYQRDIQVQQWIYRKDVFEENDIPMPTTYDELFDALVDLKDLYPESTPITASWGGAHLLSMMGAGYGIPAGWSGTRYYNEAENTWEFAPATDNYRELYRFLHRCYVAGILDPATFTQSNEDFTEKIVNGKALVTVTWISSGFDMWNEQLRDNGISGGEWAPLKAMESTIGITALPPVNTFRKGLVITANAANKPYFEDMIAFLDWAVYSQEGLDLSYWGIEGLTYETSQDGKQFLPHIRTPKNPNGTIRTAQYGFDSLFNLCENEAYEDNKKPDDIVIFLENSEAAQETLRRSPRLELSNESIEMISMTSVDLSTYISDASMKFITGELSIDDDWDVYLNDIDDLGYPILENIWNRAWKEQNDE
ncbi:MAG: extracellular solute-binding protein [Acholeplasmataceae bacterium]|nr:extracellular solute-binding protein [Acholeplasmataceae bacterium]